MADRDGAGKSLATGGGIFAAGLFIMGSADTETALHVGGGVLVGLGVAAGSFGIILSVFARNVTPENRSVVFGMGTAAGSAGMFLFSPLSAALIANFGWSHALVLLSAIMLLIPVLAIPLYGSARDARMTANMVDQTIGQALSEAMSHRSYLLLITGCFVFGFQVAFITAHFPKYINDLGLSLNLAVWGIALIG